MIGREILHYEILGRLGGGGSGEVYLARDQKLGRDVAIKRLVADRRLDPDRIHREAKALAVLSHPNIVTVHAVETVGDEQLLVMELVEGTSLNRMLSADGLAPEAVLHWGAQLAQAVAAAHEAGVLHRDLKPANIIITPDGRLKILDFGLAEVGDDTAEDEDETISRIAAITGTVAYLAPELILGRRATTSTDIFAVGVVLYEMATGRRPFYADSSVELLATIVNDPIPSVQSLVPGFPKSLARVIEGALAKIPEERPESARQLADTLEALRARSAKGSERGLKAVLAMLVPALMAGLGWWLGTDLGSRSREEQSAQIAEARRQRIAVLPFESVGPPENDYFAAGLTEEVTGRLAAVAGLRILSRTSTSRYAASDLPIREIGRMLEVDYVLEGVVQWGLHGKAGHSGPTSSDPIGDPIGDQIGDQVRVGTQLVRVDDESLVWSSSYDKVLEDIFAVQTEIAEAVIHQLGVALFPEEEEALRYRPTSDLAAYQNYLQAIVFRHRPLSDDIDRPIRLLEAAVHRDPEFALAWAELAHAHSKLHHYGHDRSASRRALAREAIDRALALDPGSAEVHLAHGYVFYWAERKYPEALGELALAAPGLPNDARLFSAQAFILRRLGRFEESLVKHAQARELDPLGDQYDRSMAVTLYFLGRYDEAAEHLVRAVELAPGEPFNQTLQIQLAWMRGDITAARAVLDSLIAAAGDRPLRPQVLALILNQLVFEGRVAQAYERLAAADVDHFSWTIRLHPKSLFQAELARQLGMSVEERAHAEKALQWVDEHLANNPHDARLHGARGLALAALDRGREAVAATEHGILLLPLEKDALNAPARLLEAAKVHMRLGQHDRAVDRLVQLFSVPCEYSTAWMALEPIFKELLQHPRFHELTAAEGSR